MLDPAILESHLSALTFADPQGFLVLADWLQAQQDPWGELIALQHAFAAKCRSSNAVISGSSASLDKGSLEQLARAPLIEQLVSLDLSDGRLNDGDVDILIRQRDRFAHLQSLDLRGNQLSMKVGARIQAALPAAKVHDQTTGHTASFFMRYVATME